MTTRGHHGLLLAGGGAPPAWTPADLASPPKLWFNDDSTATDAGSGACSGLTDISGNSGHVIQDTSGDRPLIVPAGLNGRRIIRFNGTSQSLYNDNISNFARGVFQNTGYGWMFSVYKKNGTDGGATSRCIATSVNGTDGSTRFIALAGNNANCPSLFVRREDGDSTAIINDPTARTGVWVMALHIMDWANGDGFIYIDDSLEATNTALTSTGSTSNTLSARKFMVGGYPSDNTSTPGTVNACDMDLAELIVGSGSAFVSGEISDLFAYGAARWGL